MSARTCRQHEWSCGGHEGNTCAQESAQLGYLGSIQHTWTGSATTVSWIGALKGASPV
ncbi:hypothetical protein CC1G_14348 [Coprinopsis cinerea okayama7|uniref:Uncharacterized protein n=1 Tax=Coprinopsis cinerea (strain Okayama-7 / 130 / ATCC MYA-4618 / FGSC 9003) TaxID=240176 RepID=D6RLY4_COPC7|nr:hypothetical protein CC1G_14348 [Coprinopsis cinerea okayama7\|eukprot:XP_002911349.1 hypothetical protein CC1G_14348 [Coprinopsis cinerea okayama7\